MNKYDLTFKDDGMYFYINSAQFILVDYTDIKICNNLFSMAKELKADINDHRLCCKSIIEYNETK